MGAHTLGRTVGKTSLWLTLRLNPSSECPREQQFRRYANFLVFESAPEVHRHRRPCLELFTDYLIETLAGESMRP